MTDPTLSDILGAAGAPFPVEHAGKTWYVSAPTTRARDVFHKLVIVTALKGAQAADAELPGLGDLDRFSRDMRNGLYKPGATGWLEVAKGEKGNALFLASLLYEKHPDVTVEQAEELLAAQPVAVSVALAEVIPGFFTLLAESPKMPPNVAAAFRLAGPKLAAQLRSESAPPTPPGSSTGASSI